MDDELQQLEAELKQLEPSAPPRELVARLERELNCEPVRRPLAGLRWLWVALPAAAAIAMVLVQFSGSPKPILVPLGNTISTAHSLVIAAAPNETPLKPVAAENVLISATDEGLVTLDDGTQARRERLQYVDTITWKNARTNASLTWRVPREEVRVVPIAFQ
jgi:hypothetical protein